MADTCKLFDYYDEIVKYDPVNHYYLIGRDELKTLKEKLTKEELDTLVKELGLINASFEEERRSVIYKVKPVEGFDINDYVSLASYWWPNPDTEDGFPYIRRDGEATPEGDIYDKNNLKRLAYNVYYQSILYYLTDDKSYYESLKANIRYYFLDPVTGMNPNINHGQMLKGVDEGRGGGIIDFTCNFSYTLWMLKQICVLGLVEDSFKAEFDAWLKELLVWMNTSKLGIAENEQVNNHGVFYDFGRAMLAYFIDDKQHIEDISPRLIFRMNDQIKEDGSMPEELVRTKSKCYSMMAFKGLCDFSRILEDINGNKLWDCAPWYGESNVDLKIAGDYLFERLVTKEKSWDYAQIVTFDEATVSPLVLACATYLGKDYAKMDVLDKSLMINKPLFMLLSKLA